MARKLNIAIISLLLTGLTASVCALAQDAPQIRTLDRQNPIVATETPRTLINSPSMDENKPVDVHDNGTKPELPAPAIASNAVKKALSDRVQAILNEKVIKNASVGIQILDLETGDVVYKHNETKLLKPASNTKLLTTAAALSILGAAHQFESAVYADGKIVNGVLNGNLHLHIDHDFTWSTRFYDAGDVPLRGLISQIKDAGITKINGKVIVSGYVVYGGVATGTLSTETHLKRAGNQFSALLGKSKIHHSGLTISQGAKTSGKKIATWLSPVLSEAIVPLNRVSHNEYADMLLLALGSHASGKNTYEAGAKAVKDWLKNSGLLVKGLEQHDGSGLSHSNQMSADFFTRLVAYMLKSPVGREGAASMSISGYDGTYGGRLAIDDGKGRVYAKSGTLRDTISGSGFFVNRHDGHTYAFSIIVNGMRNKKATRGAIDRIVRVFLGDHLKATLPAAPQMTSLAVEGGSVMARWKGVKNAEGYRVYKSSDGSQWNLLGETSDTAYAIGQEAAHIRVTAVNKSGTESLPSLIFSYRPGKKMMTIAEYARCRADEAMRPPMHQIAHERPLANLIGDDWGVQTVKSASSVQSDGVLFHSATCNGAIAWDSGDYEKASTPNIPVIIDIADASLSADASGTCNPSNGKVLGCFGEAILAKDRRLGNRNQNLRLRKAAGSGSTRPSQLKEWSGSKALYKLNELPVVVQEKSEQKGSYTVFGLDIQSLDSDKTLKAVWKDLKLD
ncbi:MAG: D-alanyl-D-alanine carboxypeptidase [Proteobacteria bacterium]|nr:D-alanyl-D-alanine carboxypeptidase [Pseudomonadota bacterium]